MQTAMVGVPLRTSDTPAPVFFEADRMQGHSERETEALGNVRLRTRGRAFTSDWMKFDPRYNEVTAIGNVRLEQAAYVVEGVRLRYELDTERGIMERAQFFLSPKTTGNVPIAGSGGRSFEARGEAERVLFEGPGVMRAEQSMFTTCGPGDDSWRIRSSDLKIYQDRGIGEARNARVEFKNVPVLYAPYFSFPLQLERKSGFLAPHYGTTSASGFEFSTPFFWNLAPNYDATLTPRVLAKRGVQLRSEFRYLNEDYRGNLFYEVLPDDREAQRTRQLIGVKHTHNLGYDWTGTVDVNKVSDPKYFTDLSTRVALTSQSNLNRQFMVARPGYWGDNGTYTVSGLVQSWQTLQTDPLAPITPPYSRRPQISFVAQNYGNWGDFDLQSNYVEFDHPTLTRGKRVMAYPSVSMPLVQTPGVYITPKVGMHMTRYYLDQNTSLLPDSSRAVPIMSLAGGMTFERNTNLFGGTYTQTLEPKAYYVNIPYRDQSRIPNFDSGLQDISFATIFAENQFSGHDRINDANQLTLGASSRLINPANGFEVVRGALAQRYYFESQRVTLPGIPPRNNQSARSDLLAALSGAVARNVHADVGWQYNTDTRQTQRSTIALRYQPEPRKVLNVAYRQNVNSAFRQWDTSVQWPIAQGWNAIGRWNYSVPDGRALETLAGLEYDGGCYMFRVVAHRLSTTTAAANTSVFMELQLNGVARAGSNLLDLLRRNIGGYTRPDPYSGRQSEYVVPEL